MSHQKKKKNCFQNYGPNRRPNVACAALRCGTWNLQTKGPGPREKFPTIVGAQTDRYKDGAIYNPRGTDTHPHLGWENHQLKKWPFLGGIC